MPKVRHRKTCIKLLKIVPFFWFHKLKNVFIKVKFLTYILYRGTRWKIQPTLKHWLTENYNQLFNSIMSECNPHKIDIIFPKKRCSLRAFSFYEEMSKNIGAQNLCFLLSKISRILAFDSDFSLKVAFTGSYNEGTMK